MRRWAARFFAVAFLAPLMLVALAGAAGADETIVPAVDETVGDTVDPIVETVEPIGESVDPIVETVEPIGESVDPIVETVEPVVDETVAAVEPVLEAVEPVVDETVAAVEPVLEAVEPVLEPIEPVLEPVGPVEPVPDETIDAAGDDVGWAGPTERRVAASQTILGGRRDVAGDAPTDLASSDRGRSVPSTPDPSGTAVRSSPAGVADVGTRSLGDTTSRPPTPPPFGRSAADPILTLTGLVAALAASIRLILPSIRASHAPPVVAWRAATLALSVERPG